MTHLNKLEISKIYLLLKHEKSRQIKKAAF